MKEKWDKNKTTTKIFEIKRNKNPPKIKRNKNPPKYLSTHKNIFIKYPKLLSFIV